MNARGTAAHLWDDDNTELARADDPRSDQRRRGRLPDPILDRINRHLSPTDDDLPLAQAIRHHQALNEHTALRRPEVRHG